MDSIKLSGYLQLIKENNNNRELLYSGHNTINDGFFTVFLLNLIERRTTVLLDNRISPVLCIDGIGIGSSHMLVGQWGTSVWATYAGTFWFGTNANCHVEQTGDTNYAQATWCGTFNFTGAATVNFLNLGYGTAVMWGGTFDDPIGQGYSSILAYKNYLEGTQLTFGTNDILRVLWAINFGH